MTLSEAAKYQDDISRSLRIPKLVEWLSDRSVKMVYLQVQCFISAQKLSLISKASFTNFFKPSITSTPNFALWLKVVEGARNTRKWTCGERSWEPTPSAYLPQNRRERTKESQYHSCANGIIYEL